MDVLTIPVRVAGGVDPPADVNALVGKVNEIAVARVSAQLSIPARASGSGVRDLFRQDVNTLRSKIDNLALNMGIAGTGLVDWVVGYDTSTEHARINLLVAKVNELVVASGGTPTVTLGASLLARPVLSAGATRASFAAVSLLARPVLTAVAADASLPAQVTGVTVTPGAGDSLDVSWTAVAGADSYTVEWEAVTSTVTGQASLLARPVLTAGATRGQAVTASLLARPVLTATATTSTPAPTTTEAWTGANGADWPAGWTFKSTDTSGTTSRSVQNNKGRQSAAATGAWRYDLLTSIGSLTDVDFTVTLDLGTAGTGNGHEGYALWRINPAQAALTGYALAVLAVGPSYGRLRLYTAPAFSGLQTVLFTYVPGTVYKLRVKATGDVQQAKLWPAADTEPAAWTLEFTGQNHTAAGQVGLGIYSADGARTVDWDDLTGL